MSLLLFLWASSAEAVPCKHIVQMLENKLPAHYVASTVRRSDYEYTKEDFECLERAGVAEVILLAAKDDDGYRCAAAIAYAQTGQSAISVATQLARFGPGYTEDDVECLRRAGMPKEVLWAAGQLASDTRPERKRTHWVRPPSVLQQTGPPHYSPGPPTVRVDVVGTGFDAYAGATVWMAWMRNVSGSMGPLYQATKVDADGGFRWDDVLIGELMEPGEASVFVIVDANRNGIFDLALNWWTQELVYEPGVEDPLWEFPFGPLAHDGAVPVTPDERYLAHRAQGALWISEFPKAFRKVDPY